MITERDIAILLALTRYYVLSTPLIQQLCFPTDTSGRVARRRLGSLVDQHLLNRQSMLYCAPNGGAPASVYFPAVLGNELLASHFDNPQFLATSTLAPIPHHIPHWIEISKTHIAFDTAVEKQEDSKIEGWINEYDVVNKDESDPARRYRLYSLLRESPRLICAPDAAILLSIRGHKKVFYLEQDRNTIGARQVADGKTKGYAELSERHGHFRHFPDATIDSFTVMMVTTHPKRRDILREAIKGKPGASLWRFATVQDMKPATLLNAPIWYPCEGNPSALIRGKEGS